MLLPCGLTGEAGEPYMPVEGYLRASVPALGIDKCGNRYVRS